MHMTPWTTREVKLLREYCHLGATNVRSIIFEETGKERTRSAIQSKASRLGLSLLSHEICPECGQIARRLIRNRFSDGLCPICYAKSAPTPSELRAEIMRRIHAGEPDPEEIKAARRERDRLRKQKQTDRNKQLQTF